MFMSFIFWNTFGIVDISADPPTMRALGSWDTRVTLTTAEDIGRLTAEALLSPDAESLINGVVYTAGDTVNYADLARIVEDVTGKEVRRELWDVAMLVERLARDPKDELAKYRVVFAKGRGVAWGKDTSFNGQRGIEVTDAAQWARDNLR
jgi:nucleoside-diphosphate-sugar epimerase